jgi:hypothetical protein
MKRYVLINGHPHDLIAGADADLMAESPLAAVHAYDREIGQRTPKEYILHPPSKMTGFREHDPEFAHVYELPGEPLENFRRVEVSPRFLESLGFKVPVIERIR